MRARMGQTILKDVRENQTLYVFTVVLMAMGIIFGTILVHSLSVDQRTELQDTLSSFMLLVDDGDISLTPAHFQEKWGQYAKLVGIMWVFGLSVIGLPVILLLLFLKGMIIGFTVGFLVQHWKWKGISLALAGILPQNMLAVPALLIAGVAGVSFSLRLIRSRILTRKGERLPHLLHYTVLSLVMIVVLGVAALIETYLSPELMQLVIKQ